MVYLFIYFYHAAADLRLGNELVHDDIAELSLVDGIAIAVYQSGAVSGGDPEAVELLLQKMSVKTSFPNLV
ncbi:MAG: hypothetical protein Q4C55_06890 [Eubacterium sp.]|nr:hypothetical protein [Eubacterium sp.]